MKRIAMFLVAAFALVATTSCNKSSSGDYAQGTIFVNAQVSATGFYFVTDEGETLYASEYLEPVYRPTWGDRSILAYRILSEKVPGFDYNIKVYGAEKVRWGDSTIVETTDEMDNFGEGRISFQMMQWSKKTLNLFAVPNGSSKGTYTLVYNADPTFKPKFTADGYINLVMCHDTSSDQTSSNQTLGEYLSFDLSLFDELIEQEGAKGVIIEATTSLGKRDYLQLHWPLEK